jgi:hypothetical protein
MEGGRCRGEGGCGRRDSIGADGICDRQMKGVKGPEPDRDETHKEIAGLQRVPILQWMHFEKSLRDIVVEGRYRPAFRGRVDVMVPTAATQKASQFDDREAAD